MAETPEAPESIVLQAFTGLRNNFAPERLTPGDLSIALNITIDDVGQLRSRPGFERHDAASYHSFERIAGRSFGVRDGVLGTFAADRTFTPIATVGDDPLSYTSVGEVVYVSSVSYSAQIDSTNVVEPWGLADDPGVRVSPVMTPTDTLGAIAGRLLSAPPLAGIIEHYRGRIYLATGNVLWHTELYLYDKVDRTKGFVQFEDEITMVAGVSDGLYVGTTKGLYFLQGTAAGGLKSALVVESPVIAGSLAWVPTTKVHPSAGQQPLPEGDSAVFMTQAGICVGLDGGTTFNLTKDRVVFPQLHGGAALYRDDAGMSTYIYADELGTTWAMSTRSGAVAEYTNFTFSSFMPFEGGYLAATPAGLYTLGGVLDEGERIPVRARSGLMRFGGPRLSRLKAAYVTARGGEDLTLAIETGEGVRYVYGVASRVMRTMKVHMGKGMRATHFLFDLEGAMLDLDSLELLPLVVQRRV